MSNGNKYHSLSHLDNQNYEDLECRNHRSDVNRQFLHLRKQTNKPERFSHACIYCCTNYYSSGTICKI